MPCATARPAFISAPDGTRWEGSSSAGPAFEGRGERLRRHRLRDVVVQAGRETPLAVALHGIGRQGDDGDATGCASFLGADRARGLEAIHVGHLAIHEHQIVDGVIESRDGLPAIRDHVDVMSGLLQQAHGDLLIHPIVLGDQNAPAGRGGVRR